MLRLFRMATVALALVAASVFSMPSFAGDAENAYLARLVGNYTGTGKLTGQYKGDLNCRLAFKQGSGGKVNFSGRCTVTDLPSQSITGTISYDDAKKVYVARQNGRTATGKRTGSTLTFVITAKTLQGKATTTMSLSPSAISVDAVLSDNEGKSSRTHVSFKKS